MGNSHESKIQEAETKLNRLVLDLNQPILAGEKEMKALDGEMRRNATNTKQLERLAKRWVKLQKMRDRMIKRQEFVRDQKESLQDLKMQLKIVKSSEEAERVMGSVDRVLERALNRPTLTLSNREDVEARRELTERKLEDRMRQTTGEVSDEEEEEEKYNVKDVVARILEESAAADSTPRVPTGFVFAPLTQGVVLPNGTTNSSPQSLARTEMPFRS